VKECWRKQDLSEKVDVLRIQHLANEIDIWHSDSGSADAYQDLGCNCAEVRTMTKSPAGTRENCIKRGVPARFMGISCIGMVHAGMILTCMDKKYKQ